MFCDLFKVKIKLRIKRLCQIEELATANAQSQTGN